MLWIKRNIANLFTLANLFCGLIAIFCLFQIDSSANILNPTSSCYFILLGACFDFLDGLIARLFKIESPIGKQLDSLADLITFGAAPGLVTCLYLQQLELNFPFYLIGLLIPIFSAIRLAKFNITNIQINSFIGLPTPAIAIYSIGLPFLLFDSYGMKIILLLSIVLFSILMISKIHFFSFKIKNNENMFSIINISRITLLVMAIILLSLFHMSAFSFIIISYVLLSIINNFVK